MDVVKAAYNNICDNCYINGHRNYEDWNAANTDNSVRIYSPCRIYISQTGSGYSITDLETILNCCILL
jgi:hypothetical protein